MAIKASSSVTIIKVNDGDSGIIVSATAPSAPTIGQLWQTKTGQPIKRWDGKMWVIHYISVENIDVNVLSAISANLGTVTAGTIKSADDSLVFDVTNGVLKSFNNYSLESTELKSGCLSISGKDKVADRIDMVLYPEMLKCSRNGGIGNLYVELVPGHTNKSGDMILNDVPLMQSIINLSKKIEKTGTWELLHEVAGSTFSEKNVVDLNIFKWIVVVCCPNESPYRVLNTSILSVPNALLCNSPSRCVESAYGGEANYYTAIAYFPSTTSVTCRSKSNWDRTRVYGVY